MRAEAVLSRRWQYVAYACLTLVVLGLTAVLLPGASADFRRYLGGANPIWVILGASMAGVDALTYLCTAGGYEILVARATVRSLAISLVMAMLLVVAAILADTPLRYPVDIDVPWPAAWLFYPAIGCVTEILFHVVPLALLMLFFSPQSTIFIPSLCHTVPARVRPTLLSTLFAFHEILAQSSSCPAFVSLLQSNASDFCKLIRTPRGQSAGVDSVDELQFLLLLCPF